MFEPKRETDKFRLSDFVLFLTIIIATVANFAEINLSYNGITKIAAITVMIYIITTMSYNYFYDKGKIEGKTEEEYKKISEEYKAERDNITSSNIAGRISEFCDSYIKEELAEYRKGILVQYGIDYNEYEEKYLKLTNRQIKRQKLNHGAKKAIIKCNKAKPIKITKSTMFSSGDFVDRNKPIGTSGFMREKENKYSYMFTRLFTTLFAGAVGVDIILNFSLISVITWAIRMIPVMTSLVLGQMSGYKNITETDAKFKQNQINLIRMFKEWVIRNPL